ncbi:hypothetical protein [Periweissella cryptocerci]|uniref:hypothetical protein n=1 Tax=Periweissella cryptocerci TaxID=2506420 RepID=UPI001404C2E2|nr:hypothetical protein [Periweissella cryptocerci]
MFSKLKKENTKFELHQREVRQKMEAANKRRNQMNTRVENQQKRIDERFNKRLID